MAPELVVTNPGRNRRSADPRVNLINRRREFFRATPAEARAHLLELTGDILEFTELPEAIEYRQSRPTVKDGGNVVGR
jgi:hypothetical protein